MNDPHTDYLLSEIFLFLLAGIQSSYLNPEFISRVRKANFSFQIVLQYFKQWKNYLKVSLFIPLKILESLSFSVVLRGDKKDKLS